jgi:antitoxin (DNA-binding transcriptional repressor) of toxin-antitoxin stability system
LLFSKNDQKEQAEHHREHGNFPHFGVGSWSNFPELMARVRAGEEVVIESGSSPVAVISPPKVEGRLLSESLALAEARTRARGYELEIDPDFAADMGEIIRNRKPRDTSAWD